MNKRRESRAQRGIEKKLSNRKRKIEKDESIGKSFLYLDVL